MSFFRQHHLWTTPIVVYLTFKSVTMAAKSNPFDYYTFYCILMWDASCYCLPAGQKWCLDVSYLLLLRFKSAAELACNLRLPNILLGCNILVDLSWVINGWWHRNQQKYGFWLLSCTKYVGSAKIKTNGHRRYTQSDVIIH